MKTIPARLRALVEPFRRNPPPTGIYELQEDVQNPFGDGRRRYGAWNEQTVIPKGARFLLAFAAPKEFTQSTRQLVPPKVLENFLKTQFELRMLDESQHWREIHLDFRSPGDTSQHEVLFALLWPRLRVQSLKLEDRLATYNLSKVTTEAVLRYFVKSGKLTEADCIQAIEDGFDVEETESANVGGFNRIPQEDSRG